MGNDGAFINPTLIEYCADPGIEFPRSRAYRQNDQARIKHKNGAVARRFADYDCYAGQVAGQTVAHLYGAVGLYVDYFQPSFKLLNKNRDGATVVKRYSPPATPCDRFIHRQTVSARIEGEAGRTPRPLDSVALLPNITEAQVLVAHSSPECQGEAHPTHAARGRSPRHWRTRRDPFEGVWCAVLLWLQAEPDATGKALMARLQSQHPHRVTASQLRTVQRRGTGWRGIMAKTLAYGADDGLQPGLHGLPAMALVRVDHKC